MTPASRRIAHGVAVLLRTSSIGTLGYWSSGFGPIDARYMVVITVFGVAFGELHELGPGKRR